MGGRLSTYSACPLPSLRRYLEGPNKGPRMLPCHRQNGTVLSKQLGIFFLSQICLLNSTPHPLLHLSGRVGCAQGAFSRSFPCFPGRQCLKGLNRVFAGNVVPRIGQQQNSIMGDRLDMICPSAFPRPTPTATLAFQETDY